MSGLPRKSEADAEYDEGWMRREASKIVGHLPPDFDDAMEILTLAVAHLKLIDGFDQSIVSHESERGVLTFQQRPR